MNKTESLLKQFILYFDTETIYQNYICKRTANVKGKELAKKYGIAYKYCELSL